MRIEHGTPGHFIGAPNCCFRRHTSVDGLYRISTVGCYHPMGKTEEPMEIIGWNRYFETMVFRLGPDGEPVDWGECESDAYQTAEEAQRGHEAMVEKYLAGYEPEREPRERELPGEEP